METGPKDRSRHPNIGTHTRQRLIGAVALVAIVVIVVPELLSGPRDAPPTATPGQQQRTVTIDLAAGERGAIARVPPAAPTGADPAAPQPPAAAAAPELPAPAVAAQPPTPAAAPSTVPSTTATAPAVAAPDSFAAREAASAPVAAAKSAAPPGAQGWIVQLGSFAGRDNATHLATALRRKGYAAFVSEYRGARRVLYRVRVGPEQDRGRVDAIAQRLAREGYRGSVAPQP